MSFKGRQNFYTCEKCSVTIITEDQDEGVTPFLIGCVATNGCDGLMQSSCYPRGIPYKFQPDFVWRRPTEQEYKDAKPQVREHYDKGGLGMSPLPPQYAFNLADTHSRDDLAVRMAEAFDWLCNLARWLESRDLDDGLRAIETVLSSRVSKS